MRITPVTSTQNPRLKRLIKLRKPRERRAESVLIAEGKREVLRAHQAGLSLQELWVCPALLEQPMSDAVACFGGSDATNLEFFEASEPVLSKAAYHRDPEGLLGVFSAPDWSLEQLPAPTEDALYLVAVGSEKPGNLGAMVRTAAAAGCDAVLAVGPAVDVFNPNAIRNSTGAVFALPTVVVPEDDAAISWLNRHAVTIAAAITDQGSPCFESTLARPLAVVIGPEHAGLNATWTEAANLRLTIPMANSPESEGVVDSLNAANAAAILLFEAVRQHG